MDDFSNEVEILNLDRETETLDFDNDYDISDEIETLSFDDNNDFAKPDEIIDISEDDFNIESDLNEEVETLDFDNDFDETYEMTDISEDEFGTNPIDETEMMDLDADDEISETDNIIDISEDYFNIESDLNEEVETLDLNDDFDEIYEMTGVSEDEFGANPIDETEMLDLDADDEISETDDIIDISDDNFNIDSESINDFDIDASLSENSEISELNDLSVDDEDMLQLDGIENAFEQNDFSDIQADTDISAEIDENIINDVNSISDGNVDEFEDLEYSDNFENEETDEPFIDGEGLENLTEDIDDLNEEFQENENIENLSEEQAITMNDTNENGVEMNDFINEFSNDDLEQALRDNAVDNAPLTDATYVDDVFEENSESSDFELPHMTDEELAEFVDWENQHENGNYDIINNIMNDDSLTDEQKENMTQYLLDEIRNAENETHEYGQRVKGLTYDGRDIITRPPDSSEAFAENMDISGNFNEDLTDEDIEAVYTGLENYNFQGIDCFEDIERLDSSLNNFTEENWENLSLDEQKNAMQNLAQYVTDAIGLEDPPKIEFYNNPKEGDYGGFCADDNTLRFNEYMLYQNDEAADTVAHELWHAFQQQHASNPQNVRDLQYQIGFDNYIRPEDDMEMYNNQLVEAEARAFAQQIKDRIKCIGVK